MEAPGHMGMHMEASVYLFSRCVCRTESTYRENRAVEAPEPLVPVPEFSSWANVPPSACSPPVGSSDMRPRSRMLMSSVPVLWCLVHALFGIDIVAADCWYDSEKHEEGVEVQTAELCLNCTCSRGALLCYLRVCPRLPNPPPHGCILLHRYRSCCAELICSDIPSGNGIEARSETETLEVEEEAVNMENVCSSNGTIYGPGSAMDSSSDCEYCYCLGGQQRCVKPKCLLPLDGCVPAYDSTDCCPVRYNCTKDLFSSTTTTTLSPDEYEIRGGCVVDQKFYSEGDKVLGVGHSICDNCYCLRGLVRCEPLSCAPPLLGCTPLIRPGECCAASYNCSGTIETQPEPNYGQFPIVSKEYAKLRKEVQKTAKTKDAAKTVTENTNIPYYVIAETTKPLNRQYTEPIKQSPFYYSLMSRAEQTTMTPNTRRNTLPEIYYVPTKVAKATSVEPKSAPASTIRHKKYTSDSYLDGRINRGIVNANITNVTESTITTARVTIADEETTTDYPTTLYLKDVTTTDDASTITTEADSSDSTTTETTMTTEVVETATEENSAQLITVKTVLNSTDCISKEDGPTESTVVTEEYTSTSSPSEVTEVDLETKVNISTINLKMPVEIEALLNRSKNKDQDYYYDFAPTLPPSLPNLRIIPFVAADALDLKKTDPKHREQFAQDRISDSSFPYNNLFSPPSETEGGFIPKEPPLLDNFYEKNYHTTNVGTNLVTPLPVPAITNPPKSDENSCVVDGNEIKHGESVSSEGTCAICVCFYGSIVCHEPQCPIPNTGCRNSDKIDRSTCCPHLICEGEESPTVVLDRSEATPKPQDPFTVPDGASSPDPFRDVIRTEPAPDLKLLIGDMSNYLLKKTTEATTKPPERNNTASSDDEDSFSLDKVWQFLFSGIQDDLRTDASKVVEQSKNMSLEIRTANHNSLETRENINDNLIKYPGHGKEGVGLLKLAGCNIYGRMYRVGRIISELSGPCLECKCTEVGVQCENLKC